MKKAKLVINKVLTNKNLNRLLNIFSLGLLISLISISFYFAFKQGINSERFVFCMSMTLILVLLMNIDGACRVENLEKKIINKKPLFRQYFISDFKKHKHTFVFGIIISIGNIIYCSLNPQDMVAAVGIILLSFFSLAYKINNFFCLKVFKKLYELQVKN